MCVLTSYNVYTSKSLFVQPYKLLSAVWRDFLDSRFLAFRLAQRDISAQYRQALLGILWALIIPLFNSFLWILLNSSNVVKVGEFPGSYTLFVLTGTMLWSIFSDSINQPLLQLNANKALISKVNFPHEALILSGIFQILFNTIIKFLVVFFYIIVSTATVSPSIALFPLFIIPLILVGTFLGVSLLPFGALYTDVARILPILTQFLYFLSPVVFLPDKNSTLGALVSYNPVSLLIVNSRAVICGFPLEDLGHWLFITLFSLSLLVLFWVFYRAVKPIIIERISS